MQTTQYFADWATNRPIGNWAIISSQLIPLDLYADALVDKMPASSTRVANLL